MEILSDGVFAGITYRGRGDYDFSYLSYEQKALLKSITKEQRAERRFQTK